MSKKLVIIIQTLFLIGSIGTAYAGDMTVDVYEYGQHKGTMTMPANRYQDLANGMRGTGVTVRPQPLPNAAERQQAAQRRMDEWKRQNEQRHQAAMAQQEEWKKQFERRHAAAQNGFDAWKAAR